MTKRKYTNKKQKRLKVMIKACPDIGNTKMEVYLEKKNWIISFHISLLEKEAEETNL